LIAVLSDIHSNLPALRAVLADIPKDISELWILGDIIGAFPSYPCEVLDLIHNLPFSIVSILGNQEISIMEAKRGEHPDWWLGTQMRLMAWTTDQLLPHHWEYLNSLSHTVTLNRIPQGALLFHGKPGYVRGQISSTEDAINIIQRKEQHILACGHTHKARLFQMEGYTIINAGSVGVSQDGIGGTACYALLTEYDDKNCQPKVIFRHVSYDVEASIQRLKTSGLAELAPGISKAIIAEQEEHIWVAFCNFAVLMLNVSLGKK
jgi:predicted phosphodiesterase